MPLKGGYITTLHLSNSYDYKRHALQRNITILKRSYISPMHWLRDSTFALNPMRTLWHQCIWNPQLRSIRSRGAVIACVCTHVRCHTGTRHKLSELSSLSHLVLFPNRGVGIHVGSDASHAGTSSGRAPTRHAPSILHKRLPACGLTGGIDSKEQELRRRCFQQASERNPRRYSSRFDAIIREKHRAGYCNGPRAARLRRHTIVVARLTTVACDANVIAVSYQRTGSSRTYPVDTDRAFAEHFLLNTLQHPADTAAACPESERNWLQAMREVIFCRLTMKVCRARCKRSRSGLLVAATTAFRKTDTRNRFGMEFQPHVSTGKRMLCFCRCQIAFAAVDTST
jgi:hypothetical protein